MPSIDSAQLKKRPPADEKVAHSSFIYSFEKKKTKQNKTKKKLCYDLINQEFLTLCYVTVILFSDNLAVASFYEFCSKRYFEAVPLGKLFLAFEDC